MFAALFRRLRQRFIQAAPPVQQKSHSVVLIPLSNEDMERVKVVQGFLGSISSAEAFVSSMRVLEDLMNHYQDGRTFLTQDHTGRIERLPVFVPADINPGAGFAGSNRRPYLRLVGEDG